MIVKLINKEDESVFTNNAFILYKKYIVIGIEGDWYRLISEQGEPILFSPECFEIIDPTEPSFWITYYDKECGGKYSKPERWSRPYFIDDYFNSKPPVVEEFWKDCRELYGIKYFVVSDCSEFIFQENIEVTCISKHAYLRETETKDTFELMSKDINPEQMEDINLTIGKKYIVEENRRHYWYKIKDDNGKYYFFPKSMFEGWEL